MIHRQRDSERRGPASRLELLSWMMFDFANSSYTTVIITVVFSVYFVSAVAGDAAGTASG